MNSVCQPVATVKQSINLSASYLQKKIPAKTNQVLFQQASPLTDIYAVTSGLFKLCQQTDNDDENIIGLRFPGELIGEDALYLKTYNYTAIAIGESAPQFSLLPRFWRSIHTQARSMFLAGTWS